MAQNSNPQTDEFFLVNGATEYRTKSDPTATDEQCLVSGSQNVLINEATDKEGDKVETRPGYELFGAASTARNGIANETTFKTKAGDAHPVRFIKDGTLEVYLGSAWETLLTGLDGAYHCRFATVWDATELIRRLLFVNHSATLYSWSGAVATLASVAAGTITINETIATEGFLTTGTRSIRIKDSGGTWRETAYTGQAGSVFTVSSDLSGFTFDANARVTQVVSTSASTPAAGFVNDVIATVENHVYVGSHASSVVYMSKSTDFTSFTFSSPRLATEGWQFVLDDFMVGFATNISSDGRESIVFFAGNDWIYRVQFVDIGDTTIAQIASVKPIVVSSGQGAVSQELIAKVRNAIIYLNGYNELLELGSVENLATPQQTPISDSIKPDFIAADFTGGTIRFWRNNLYVTAPVSGRLFIYSFRERRRFWQPPQLMPIGQLSDVAGELVGHSNAVTESYTLLTGTNDNGLPIAFKAHFAYRHFAAREKLKNFDKYFSELYLTSNTIVSHTLLYEYLGAKKITTSLYDGSDTDFTVVPNPNASLGVNSLGTTPLGAVGTAPEDFVKYRRFKKLLTVDFFELQSRYEADDIDAQFQILEHGPNAMVAVTAPVKIIS